MRRSYSVYLSLCLVLSLFATRNHADISSGLVAYYPLDGSSADATGGPGGTEHGVAWVSGHVGPGAASFDGSSHIVIPPHTQLNGFSVAAWFKAATVSRWQRIVDFGRGPNYGDFSFIVNHGRADNQLGITIHTWENGGTSYGTYEFGSGSVPAVGEWVHAVFTYDKDGAGMKLYVNGNTTPVGSAPYNGQSFSDWPAPQDWRIGKSNWASDPNFTGAIDDVRIYNRALSPSEVKELYDLAGWVQWQVQDGGNDHWYRVVSAPAGISWANANASASNQAAYLATVTSSAENQFIFSLIGSCWNQSWGPWLGGYQPDGADEPRGGWEWVTGEGWGYTQWHPANPDDGLSPTVSENYLHYHSYQGGPSAFWNDWGTDNSAPGYVMEKGGVPAPDHIDIVGPAVVPDDSTRSYRCFAVLPDGITSNDVTADTTFSTGRFDPATFNPPSGNTLVTYDVPSDRTITIAARYTHPGSGSNYTDRMDVTIKDLDFEIRPYVDEWHNDGRTELRADPESGYYRYQYFRGQTNYLPFTVASTVDTNVSISIIVAPTNNHGVQVYSARVDDIALESGANTITNRALRWGIADNIPYGYYHIAAWVEGVEGVLDTTEDGSDTTDTGDVAVWLTNETERIQVCRGNPVVLIHGIAGSPATFGDMARILGEDDNIATVSFDYAFMTDHYCPNITQTASTGYDFGVFRFRSPKPEMPLEWGFSRTGTRSGFVELCRAVVRCEVAS
jgi:hypothetical protein